MLTIYADGACSGNPGPAGSAILLLKPKGGRLVPVGSMEQSIGHATNQIAELVAAKMAIDAAADQDETEILVRCDSEYVVKGINEWMVGWVRNGWRNAAKKPVANKEHWVAIKDGLEKVRGAQEKAIRFEWVRGHDSDEFNNMVDVLAVSASKMQPGNISGQKLSSVEPPETESAVPRSEFDRVVRMAETAAREQDEALRALKEKLAIAVSWIEELPRKNASHQMLDHTLAELKQALGR